MAHAHPLSDGPYLPLHRLSSVSPSTSISTPRNSGSPTQLPDSASQHRKRLQLRNAGFRAQLVPARNISPFVFANSINDENSPMSVERRTIQGGDLTPSPTSILQAINNTTSRCRHTPRASLSTTLQDFTATKTSDRSQINSWYNEASNNSSPMPRAGTPLRMMKLREGSLNEKTVPTSSTPPMRYERSKRTARPKSRISSGEATKYIEHLEAELATLNAKLDALTSPAKVKAQSSKYRALHAQVRRQTEELAEWEQKFEERVTDEIYERTQTEQGLKARIKELEDSCKAKEAKIEALESELENTKVKAKDVESLESTNQCLERRLDVLTELIAQSPTRNDFVSGNPAPGSAQPSTQTPRPRPRSLLLPKMPSFHSSPVAARLSANYSTDLASWHGRNIASISSLSISENPEDEMRTPFENERLFVDTSEMSMRSASFESGYNRALSSPSTSRTASRSRPSSMISNYSFGASLGSAVSSGHQEEPKSPFKSRKMRRFPSGACALKPLILPVATGATPSLPVSAPACSNHTTPFADLSSDSIDPTIEFLSKDTGSSLFTTPTQAPRRRSADLEHKPKKDSFHDLIQSALHEDESYPGKSESPDEENVRAEQSEMPVTPSPAMGKPKRRSLQMELEAADKAALAGSDGSSTANSSPDSFQKSSIDSEPQLGVESMALSATSNVQSGSEHSLRQSRLSTPPMYPATPFSSFTSSQPKSSLTPEPLPPTGLLTRLKTVVTSLHQDPLHLARHLLVKVCGTISSYAGGLGWWLLGLVFRYSHREKEKSADRTLVEEEPRPTTANGIDWHEYSAEASKMRRRKAFMESAQVDEDVLEWTPDNRPRPEKVAECKDCIEPPARRSLRLWLRFSLAIVLAVGVAVKDGPETLLVDRPRRRRRPSDPDDTASREPDHPSRKSSATASLPTSIQSLQSTLVAPGSENAATKFEDPRKRGDGNWGWEAMFAENLGPADFEGKKDL
jgi:cytochrome c556